MKRLHAFLAVGTALALSGGAQATDVVLRAGVADVVPKSDNNPAVSVDSNATLSLGATVFFTKNFAVDILGALPFKHDIKLTAAGAAAVGNLLEANIAPGTTVGSTKQLPPTVTAQWHFLPGNVVDPYVGVGVNYTNFFNKKTAGPIAGTQLNLTQSWGLAAEAGLDFNFGNGFVLSTDVRYAKISTHAKVMSGNALVLDVGTVNIDPIVYGINFGKHFDL
jgi:outer membrane protein